MAEYYDAVDILWSDDGDLAIGRNGDIASTVFDPLLAIAQDIYDRVKCDRGDYSETPEIGASLSEFVGETNTRERGRQIERRILSSIRPGSYISLTDVAVNAFPISRDTIVAKLSLLVKPTRWNKNSRILTKLFFYSFDENHIYPINRHGED